MATEEYARLVTDLKSALLLTFVPQRSLLGDPGFSRTHDIEEYQRWMLADSTALLTKIDDERTHNESGYYIPNGMGLDSEYILSNNSLVSRCISLTTKRAATGRLIYPQWTKTAWRFP